MKLQTFLPVKNEKQLEAITLLFSNNPSILEVSLNNEKTSLRFHEDQTMEFFGCYSRSEQILVRIALDIWSYSGNSNLSDVLAILDQDRFEAFLAAISRLKTPSQSDPF